MVTKAQIDAFIAQKSMAVAGISASGKRFGNIVFRTLSQKGYKLYPIHPGLKEIEGVKCYHSVKELPEHVKNLLLIIPPHQSDKTVREIPDSPVEHVWMHQGASSPESIRFCEENNIDCIHGWCILMFAEPRGFHKLHHWVRELLGRNPV